MSKIYRLKVKKIPLEEEIPIQKIKFKPIPELYLDLLENKTKLKKNPPKPIFVRPPETPKSSKKNSDSESEKDTENKKSLKNEEPSDSDDFTLKELEKAYEKSKSVDSGSNELVFDESDKENLDSKNQNTNTSEKINDTKTKQNPDDLQAGGHQKNDQILTENQVQIEEDIEEKERQEKADLIFKFMVLRKQYKNVEIPEFTEHSDLSSMKRTYDQIIRRVTLDSNIITYKKYLGGGFMIMEFIATKFIGLDIAGFANFQSKTMNQYDELLIELGEKNYTGFSKRFPIELRLIFAIVMSAGMFYMQKKMFDSNGFEMISKFMGLESENSTGQGPQLKKRTRMRGPSISPEQVGKMAELSKQAKNQTESRSQVPEGHKDMSDESEHDSGVNKEKDD